MFIKEDSLVEIIAGPLAGRHGRVEKVVAEVGTGQALIMVSIFYPDDGRFYSVPFGAAELRLKKYDGNHLAQLLAMEENAQQERRAA